MLTKLNSELFHMVKVTATAAMILGGLGKSILDPGPMDVPLGAIVGAAIYVLWLLKERTQ